MIRGNNYTGKSNRLAWEAKDLDYLRAHYATDSSDEIAIHLGVSTPSVRAKARKLGLEKLNVSRRHRWTADELQYLVDRFSTESGADIADHLGVSPTLVCNKARELGLKKSDDWSKRQYTGRYVGNYRKAV